MNAQEMRIIFSSLLLQWLELELHGFICADHSPTLAGPGVLDLDSMSLTHLGLMTLMPGVPQLHLFKEEAWFFC